MNRLFDRFIAIAIAVANAIEQRNGEEINVDLLACVLLHRNGGV